MNERELIGTDLTLAIKILEQGGIVAIPTETVYGLAGKIDNPQAINKIFKAKGRPSNDPLIVHCSDLEMALEKVIKNSDQKIKDIAAMFWPGPLTLILEKQEKINSRISAELNTVGVRVPGHPLFLELIRSLGSPVAAPSANPFGYISPTTPGHVKDQLGEKVDYILDGGPCRVGIESTILDLSNETPRILREGMISKEDLENIIGPIIGKDTFDKPAKSSPGDFEKHYSPRTQSWYFSSRDELPPDNDEETAFLLFSDNIEGVSNQNQWILSENQKLQEAARRLYHFMREIDKQGFSRVLMELVPEKGIGKAINERIIKACAGKHIIFA